jgi:hypothetical protein
MTILPNPFLSSSAASFPAAAAPAAAPCPATLPAAAEPLGCLTAEDEALYWSLRFADDPFVLGLDHIPDAHALFDAIEGLPDLREAS